MSDVSFEIIGDPKAQGSKVAFLAGGKARMKEAAGQPHATWRNQVAQVAAEVAQHDDIPAPLDGPLTLEVEFRFRMPKSRPARIRALGEHPKTTAPDTSKLVRALEDGLQAAGLVTDDARFWNVNAWKVETVTGWTGARVTITHHEGASS